MELLWTPFYVWRSEFPHQVVSDYILKINLMPVHPILHSSKLPLEKAMTALRHNFLPSTCLRVSSSLRFPKPGGLFSGTHILKLMLNPKDHMLRGLIGFGQRMSLSEVNLHVDNFFSPPNHDCENVNHVNYNERSWWTCATGTPIPFHVTTGESPFPRAWFLLPGTFPL